tara:strand:- start:5 stop:1030 length:1026 start_codon:yes stop_codon:yes gene_type:complete
MPSSKKIKIFNDDKLDKSKKRIFKRAQELNESVLGLDGSNPTAQPLNTSGVFGGETYEPKVRFNFAPSEKGIDNGNAYITLGKDRPSGKASGLGGQGATGANAIDIVVGRLSSALTPDGTYADNSFSADAARVYISQLTNIDFNFGIDPGKSGYMEGRSGIGIKADGVRVIGREGVKIVTGRSNNATGFGMKGETNSLGGKISQPAPLIELIAGNNTEPTFEIGGLFNGATRIDKIQGVAMGQNTTEALRGLSDLMTDMLSLVKIKFNAQFGFNTALSLAASLPAPLAGPATAAAYAVYNGAHLKSNYNMYQLFIDKAVWDVNYLQPYGKRYIESRNVKTT